MLTSYYPEMKEDRPAAQIDASLGHYGKQYYLKTPLVLKGSGIVHTGTLTAEQLVPSAQHKAGWHTYKVTLAAFDAICEKYEVASESLL